MNRRVKGYRYIFAIAIIALMGSLFINNQKAVASEIVLPEEYYFVFNGVQRKAGTEYEMRDLEVLLNVTAGTWEQEDTRVEWVSSKPSVVGLEETSHGSNFVKLVRKGPGFSTITAVIKQGGYSYSISCQVKVGLQFDYQKTGMVTATTTQERILILDKIDDKKQVYLRYVDYITEGEEGIVEGEEISFSAVTWESDNEAVITVDEKGKVTAVGSGSANIIVTTNTMSSQDRALQISMTTVVKPTFSLDYVDSSGEKVTAESSNNSNTATVARDVPSNFVLESNANFAENLKWEVYDFSNGRRLPANGDKLSYSVSTISGNVSFSNVKAGTYEIYAFANERYNTGTNAPYAYMKIIVPIVIEDLDIVMNVGDSYDLIRNSNVPGVGVFEYFYAEGNPNIARMDQTTGIITARRKGQVKLKLVYKTAQNLYDDASITIDDIYVNITIIDGISLNLTNTSMFTSGTLLLQALVTDPNETVNWYSSDIQIASVEGGLVTAHRPGIVTITAYQNINGVIKSASSEITIQQSVSRITIDPSTLTLPIGGYKTLHASITPSNLTGVKLEWKSSNDSIVEIVESMGFTATIQAKRGGNVVISAINQDNVVVGYSHVTVEQPVTRISLSETNVTLNLSQRSMQLRASVYPENANNKTIKWTSTDTSKARVDDNGLVTLVSPGSVSIIASSKDNPNETAICNINIEIPVASVALDERTKTMYVGQSSRLTYVVLPVNASKNGVTWESTDTSVVTVDASGRVSARGVGTAVVILRTLEGGHSVYSTINVRQVPSGVSFNVSQLDLDTGETYRLRPSFTPANSTDTNLSWESSDTNIAVVNDEGVVEGRNTGSAIVYAKTETGGTAFVTVNVTQPVEGLILNYLDKTIYVKESFEMKASVNPSNASELAVTWTSSNTDVITVTRDGIVTGIKGGTAIITASTADGGHKESCVVTVREFVSEVTLSHSQYVLGVGKTVTLTASVTTPTATNQDVRWVSSNTRIASVNQRGRVTGHRVGDVTITAISKDGSQVEAYCEIEVVRPVTRITLDRSFMTMYVGETRNIKASVTPNNATYRNPIYTSSDEDVAIVTEDGNIIGVSAGTVTITARAQDNSNKSAICVVTVNNRVPATSITVMERRVTMVPGETKFIQVALNPANSTDNLSWSSDNTAIARVDGKTGKITARNTGTALITVMTDSAKLATIEVVVMGLNFTNVTLEQYSRSYQLTVEGATSPVTWTIDNPEIAVLRRQGNNSVVIESRAVGKTTITARVNGRSLRCNLTVRRI